MCVHARVFASFRPLGTPTAVHFTSNLCTQMHVLCSRALQQQAIAFTDARVFGRTHHFPCAMRHCAKSTMPSSTPSWRVSTRFHMRMLTRRCAITCAHVASHTALCPHVHPPHFHLGTATSTSSTVAGTVIAGGLHALGVYGDYVRMAERGRSGGD